MKIAEKEIILGLLPRLVCEPVPVPALEEDLPFPMKPLELRCDVGLDTIRDAGFQSRAAQIVAGGSPSAVVQVVRGMFLRDPQQQFSQPVTAHELHYRLPSPMAFQPAAAVSVAGSMAGIVDSQSGRLVFLTVFIIDSQAPPIASEVLPRMRSYLDYFPTPETSLADIRVIHTQADGMGCATCRFFKIRAYL